MAGCQRRPTLVYDGDCGFCTRCAEWVRRRLPQAHDVVAWQELPDLDALGLTVADVASASYWIDADGRPHRGERGVALALIEIGPSAGLNLMFDRYRYDYGAYGTFGDNSSPVQLKRREATAISSRRATSSVQGWTGSKPDRSSR